MLVDGSQDQGVTDGHQVGQQQPGRQLAEESRRVDHWQATAVDHPGQWIRDLMARHTRPSGTCDVRGTPTWTGSSACGIGRGSGQSRTAVR